MFLQTHQNGELGQGSRQEKVYDKFTMSTCIARLKVA
jgi:hypothetical protein